MISKLLIVTIALFMSSGNAKTTADEVYQKELDKLDPVKSMNVECSDLKDKDRDASDCVQDSPFTASEEALDVPEFTMDSPEVDLVLKEDFFFINSQDSIEKPQKLSIDSTINSDSEEIVIQDATFEEDEAGVWDQFANFCKNLFGFNDKSERS